MSNTIAPSSTALEVRRTIRAPRQRVFDAWTKPEELKKWHAPGPMTVALADMDLRVGGAYRIHMQAPGGEEHRVVGTYREVDPPRRVVYTWKWETGTDDTVSVVSIDFVERGAETEVVLRHDGFSRDEARASHLQGWNAIMDKMVAHFNG
ncbi:MAG: SRPBCC domain-containing protein [Gemmatimonadaceae bacterium]